MHHRFSPKTHRFHYHTFMWWIDLDEPAELAKKNFFVGYNRFNLFSFNDKDHVGGESNTLTVKENVIAYLKEKGHDWPGGKIYLLTNLRMLGYLFNPVSFYYFISDDGRPAFCIAEVGNTYYEMKNFLLTDYDGSVFELRTPKHFYVSPFTKLDDEFHFRISVPGEQMNIKIDTYRGDDKFFISTLTGRRKPLTTWSAIKIFLRFPFLTLQIIFLIHWQALKLWIKKIPFESKAANKDLQREVNRKHKSLDENLS